MLKRAMKRAMRKFGQRYDYDVGYMEHFIDVDPAACYKFSKVQPASAYRCGNPVTASTVNQDRAHGRLRPLYPARRQHGT